MKTATMRRIAPIAAPTPIPACAPVLKPSLEEPFTVSAAGEDDGVGDTAGVEDGVVVLSAIPMVASTSGGTSCWLSFVYQLTGRPSTSYRQDLLSSNNRLFQSQCPCHSSTRARYFRSTRDPSHAGQL